MAILDEQRRLARHLVDYPGGQLSARAATCLNVVLGALEDAERDALDAHAAMRRMADERDAALAELEAARAVVEAAEALRAAHERCDAEVERCRAKGQSLSSAPMVHLIACNNRLHGALDAYNAAKAGKAVK